LSSLLDLNVELPSPTAEVAVEELAVGKGGTAAADAEGEIAETDLEGVEVIDLRVEGRQ
jgi:hypothetical protein